MSSVGLTTGRCATRSPPLSEQDPGGASDALTARFVSAMASRFRIEGECGRGASSIVYRAWDVRDDRRVALKVLRAELAAAASSERFLREVRIAQSLAHPNIAPVLEFGEAEGTLYCVMPFIEGDSLRSRLAREGPLPIDEALRLTREVGAALSHAHRRGVVHRDVKPENVLLEDGRALLTDFGIARAILVAAGDRLTESGVSVGTPAYMSPEQATADAALDERTDQYALAICLYEMLAGDPPFRGRNSQAIIARHVSDAPPPLETVRPAVDLRIVAAIERALAKVPGDRFESVDAFLGALERRSTKLARPSLRRPRFRAAAAVAGTAVLAIAWWVGSAAPLDDARVLVFPARTAAVGSDPSEGLRIADAIQVAVEHTEPLRWIPAWEGLDEATRADPGRLRTAEARALARRRGARYYVLSAIDTVGGRPQVMIWLHDAEGDTVITQVSARDSTGLVSSTALAIRALPRLLAKMLDPGARVDLSPLTDRRLSAIVKLFEAEEAYRTAHFADAFAHYRRAIEEDSVFPYAALRGAQAASWLSRDEDARVLVRIARRHEGLLPPKYRPYLVGIDAYLGGHADSAVAGFSRALEVDRYWAEAATALGDVYYHLIPTGAQATGRAAALFERALEIDSLFRPPLFHLAELSLRSGDRARGARYRDRFTAGATAESEFARQLAVMQRCTEGPMTQAEWAVAAARSADETLVIAKALGAGAGQARCALGGFRAVIASPQAAPGAVYGAILGLHGLLVATGRANDAVRLLDSARTSVTSRVLAFGLIGMYADSALRPVAEAAEEFGRRQFGERYERARPSTAWAFGIWEAWKGNRGAVEAIADRMRDSARATGQPVHLLAAASLDAHLALLRGDTTEAIGRFGALPIVASTTALSWEFLEPLAPDRITYASLLLARGRAQEALDAASVFDHPQPVAYFAFVRRSLEVRLAAAQRLGRSSLASELQARLRALSAVGASGY